MPIGNLEDITLRGVRLLKEAEIILVENFKTGKKILNQLNIDSSAKEIIPINRKNELSQARVVLENMFMKYQKVCFISDCGHPAIADSGHVFLKHCLEYGINVRYVPGASSILGALLVSGFPNDSFYYRGFLPRQRKERNQALAKLKEIRSTIIIMETAYRLEVLISSIKKIFSPKTLLCLAFDLTTREEFVFHGQIGEAIKRYSQIKNRQNFVLVIDNNLGVRR